MSAKLALANACLVSASAVCMLLGHRAIRRRRIARHRNLMIGAFATSLAFMISFVVRFVRFGRQPFHGSPSLAVFYNILFFSHEPLAVVSIPLVTCALVLGLAGSYRSHREIARFALPIWLYAALSGIVLYAVLYR